MTDHASKSQTKDALQTQSLSLFVGSDLSVGQYASLGITAQVSSADVEQSAINTIEFNEVSSDSRLAFQVSEPATSTSGFAIGFAQNDFVGDPSRAQYILTSALGAASVGSTVADRIAIDITLAGNGFATTAAADAALNAKLSSDASLNGSGLQSIAAINNLLETNTAAQASITQSSNSFLTGQWANLTSMLFAPTGQSLYAPVASVLQGPSNVYSIALQILTADYNNQYPISANGPMAGLYFHGSGTFGPAGSPPITIPPNATPQQVLTAFGNALLSTTQASKTFAGQFRRLMQDLSQANALAMKNGLATLPPLTFSSPYGSAAATLSGSTINYSGSNSVDGGPGQLNPFSGTAIPDGGQGTETTNNPGGTSTVDQVTPIGGVTLEQTVYSQPSGLGAIESLSATVNCTATNPSLPSGATVNLPPDGTFSFTITADRCVASYNDTVSATGPNDSYYVPATGTTLSVSNSPITESWGGQTLTSGSLTVAGNNDTISQGAGSWLDLSGSGSTVSDYGGSGLLAVDLLSASTSATINAPANVFFSNNQQSFNASNADAWMFSNGQPLTYTTDYLNGNGDYANVEPNDRLILNGSSDTFTSSADDILELEGNSAALDLDTGTLFDTAVAYYDNTTTDASQEIQFDDAGNISEILTDTSGLNGTGTALDDTWWYTDGDQQEYFASGSASVGPDGGNYWSLSNIYDWFSGYDGDAVVADKNASPASTSTYVELTSESFRATAGSTTYGIQVVYSYQNNVLQSETQTVSNLAGTILGTTRFGASGNPLSTTGTYFHLTLPSTRPIHVDGGGRSGVHPATASTTHIDPSVAAAARRP